MNGKKTGIHATPKKNVDKILSRGLRKIPFWQSRVPIRKPFEFRFAYLPFSNVVSGKTKAERTDAIFDALKAANIHLTGSSRNKFQIRRIGLILVDLGKARIHKSETRIMKGSKGIPKKVEYTGEKLDEILLTSPPEALTQVKMDEKEIQEIEHAIKGLGWFEANRKIAEMVCDKVSKML